MTTEHSTKPLIVQSVLQRSGPLLSADLATMLIERGFAGNGNSARKMIQRAVERRTVISTEPVRFDTSPLCYLKDHLQKQYGPALRKAFEKKPPFLRIYKTLLANKGYISSGQIAKAGNCGPSGPTRSGGRLSLFDAIHQLKQIQVIDSVMGEPNLFSIAPVLGRPEVSKHTYLGKLALEQEVSKNLMQWFGHCYLLAANAHTLRDSEFSATEFNQFYWDFHGPLFLGPMSTVKQNRRSRATNDFFAGEVCAFRSYSEVDAAAVIERVNTINHRWKTISLTPVVVAIGFSQQAWNDLRSAGIAAIKIADVLGKNAEELLFAISKALEIEFTLATDVEDIETALKIYDKTTGADGLVGTLKGAMFELLVAMYYRSLGYDIIMQRMVRKHNQTGELEIDIVASKGDKECLIIECKGRHSGQLEDLKEVKKHFEDRCGAAANVYEWDVKAKFKSVKSIFITTGKTDEQIQEFVNKTKKSFGIDCAFIDRTEFIGLLRAEQQDRLLKLIEQFY